MSIEQQIWRGSPSHLTKFFHYLGAILLAVAAFLIAYAMTGGSDLSFAFPIIPLFYALYIWLEVRSLESVLTTQRLRTSTGIFNKKTDELELYRIKDYQLESPFFYRLFSLANVTLITSDRSTPTITLYAVKNGQALLDQIRNLVEARRDRNGVRELDMESSN